MNKSDSIIDSDKLNLILNICTPKESRKIKKRIDKLFNGLSKDSLKVVNLLSKYKSTGLENEHLDEYNIGNRKIVIIKNDKDILKAVNDIRNSKYIGFDTEQKPTFNRGERQNEISIIQIATSNHIYLFQMLFLKNIKPVTDIISDPDIRKIGFDLKNDNREFLKQFKIIPQNIYDLSIVIKKNFFHKNQIGVKSAVALFMDKKIIKSKKTVLSNWENENLTPNQIKYATEDATAPYDIYTYMLENFSMLLS